MKSAAKVMPVLNTVGERQPHIFYLIVLKEYLKKTK